MMCLRERLPAQGCAGLSVRTSAWGSFGVWAQEGRPRTLITAHWRVGTAQFWKGWSWGAEAPGRQRKKVESQPLLAGPGGPRTG